VIDLLKQPQLASGDQILATPTVVRRLLVPMRTVIGNLSDIDNVLVGLDLKAGD
jgi:circadian clock protein KaiB